jgi:NADH-quinone oxidoreductase subunit G
MLSPAVAELAPRPYLALNAEDIRHLKIAEGDMIALIGKTDLLLLELPVKQEDSLPKGVAGLPFGLPDLKLFDYSEKCRVETAWRGRL